MTHTKGKFYYSPEKMLSGWRIMREGKTIATVEAFDVKADTDSVFKNVEMIVNSLNQNFELLEALKEILHQCKNTGWNDNVPQKYAIWDKAEQAIKNAE